MSKLLSDRNTQEMGQNSTSGSHIFQEKIAQSAPQRTTTSLSSFILKTVKLNFPKYNGKEDHTTCVCCTKHFLHFMKLLNLTRYPMVEDISPIHWDFKQLQKVVLQGISNIKKVAPNIGHYSNSLLLDDDTCDVMNNPSGNPYAFMQ
ncbi:hypothetical protein FEM48_Zijuj01G0240100 [Ziziphus jujuba var. spinosa]|uniref:Uncharacterized protein n=1 Tax=Ziziphus jujuba var. spinosa TaxID=714518 RepID=A0A978W4C1_ZIZJJ|nr:hypothetical protein FEM48_Zijuj01G0240100 [Ziziphus jujuba var. spinosa]